MKITSKVIQTVGAVALLNTAGCSTCFHGTRAWDYRVIAEMNNSELERKLNEAGAQGYAIVSSATLPTNDAGSTSRTIVILKRQKP